jgi:hypothetical protein
MPYIFNAWRLLAVDDPTVHMCAQGGKEDAHLQPSEIPGEERERRGGGRRKGGDGANADGRGGEGEAGKDSI